MIKKEMLFILPALEEWQHFMEGAHHGAEKAAGLEATLWSALLVTSPDIAQSRGSSS